MHNLFEPQTTWHGLEVTACQTDAKCCWHLRNSRHTSTTSYAHYVIYQAQSCVPIWNWNRRRKQEKTANWIVCRAYNNDILGVFLLDVAGWMEVVWGPEVEQRWLRAKTLVHGKAIQQLQSSEKVGGCAKGEGSYWGTIEVRGCHPWKIMKIWVQIGEYFGGEIHKKCELISTLDFERSVWWWHHIIHRIIMSGIGNQFFFVPLLNVHWICHPCRVGFVVAGATCGQCFV